MISLYKMAPSCSTKVLSSVSQCKNSVMGLMEKIGVLDKLYGGKSYSAVG